MKKRFTSVKIFLAALVSTFSVIITGAFVLLILWPGAVNFIDPVSEYYPQLPTAEARDEEFLEVDEIEPKQPYPALTDVGEVDEGNWIRIPSIGVKVPLVLSKTMHDKDVLATLDDGAALYPNGISPGQLGNAFIAGHSTGNPWQGAYRFAFLRMRDLQEGNLIHIDYNGSRYTYKFVREEVVTPHPDYRVVSDRPVPTLTLMTCTPLWTAAQRLLTHAELVNITQLTQPDIS